MDMQTFNEAQAARRARLQMISTTVRYVLLFAVGLVMLYPLIWLIGASFKTNSEIFAGAGFIPENPTVDGYVKGWETSTPYTFGRFFWNSFLIIMPKVIGTPLFTASSRNLSLAALRICASGERASRSRDSSKMPRPVLPITHTSCAPSVSWVGKMASRGRLSGSAP